MWAGGDQGVYGSRQKATLSLNYNYKQTQFRTIDGQDSAPSKIRRNKKLDISPIPSETEDTSQTVGFSLLDVLRGLVIQSYGS